MQERCFDPLTINKRLSTLLCHGCSQVALEAALLQIRSCAEDRAFPVR